MAAEYLVRSCLKCGYSFKSRADVEHPKCSKCASSRVVLAKEMPEQNLNSIEIRALGDRVHELEAFKEWITQTMRESFVTERDAIGKVNKRIDQTNRAINKYFKTVGG